MKELLIYKAYQKYTQNFDNFKIIVEIMIHIVYHTKHQITMLLDSRIPQGLVKANAAARRSAVNAKDPEWVLAPDTGR